MIQKRISLAVIFCSFFSVAQAATLLLGNRADDSNWDSFDFNLKTFSVFDAASEFFYVGAAGATTGDARPYSLTGFSRTGSCQASPETVTLNGTASTTSPIYGKAIGALGIIGKNPIVTPGDDLDAIYWITSKLGAATQTMVGVTSITDAGGGASPGIVSDANGIFAGTGNYLFAAIKPNGGNFGAANGGIAVLKKTATALTQEKAVNGNDSDVLAVEIALDTTALTITNNLASLVSNAVDLHWDATLQRLYIGVRATGAGGGTDGARSVIVARLDEQSGGAKLIFNPIAPDAAFTAATDTEIVGGKGASVVAEAYRVRTMHTTGGSDYLIMQGDADASAAITDIYALPLVNEKANPANVTTWKTSATHGAIAKKNTAPTIYYGTTATGVSYQKTKGIQTAATAAGDLFNTATTADDKKVKVGGAVVPGTISDIKIYKDTVFVSTNAKTSPDKPALFYSQAILDEDDLIADWTPWQVVAYPTGSNVFEDFAYAPTNGQLFTLEGPVGSPDTVKITSWGTGALDGLLGGTTSDSSVGFVSKINSAFTQENGGVMGLFDFDNQNPAFIAKGNTSNLGLMIATGYKKVAIIKTGDDDGTDYIPGIGNAFDQINFTAGAIDSSVSGKEIITVTGGDLNTLGAITCAAVTGVVGSTEGYIVVGGSGGLAILRHSTSYAGWANTGLVKALETGFGTTQTFQKVTSITGIRKLWTAYDSDASNQVVYILTSDTLYRMAVAQLAQATPTVTTIATTSGLGLSSGASFADFIASRKLGILATSEGLYRTANGKDVSSDATVTWTEVALPEGYTSATQLVPLSTTTLPYEFAGGNSGQVYVLSGAVGKGTSALFKFVIADASSSVGATTVQHIPNVIIEGINGPFTQLGAYRNMFATNGATLLVASSKNLSTAPQLVRLPLAIGSGSAFRYSNEKALEISLPDTATSINGMVRNSATGSWIVYGDFGVLVLE